MKKNNISIFSFVTILIFSFSVSMVATAQENTPITQFPQETEPREASTTSTSSNKNKTRIKVDFEDQLVTGKHDMPEAEMVFTRTQFNYKKMIRLRDNFIPEVKQGKDEFRGRN